MLDLPIDKADKTRLLLAFFLTLNTGTRGDGNMILRDTYPFGQKGLKSPMP